MKGFSDLANDRRFHWSLAVSIVLTTFAFSLMGWVWKPRVMPVPPPARRSLRIAFRVLPPPPRPILVRHIAPKPVKVIPPRKVIVPKPPRPRLKRTPVPKMRMRRATLRRASARHNPRRAIHPAPAGGASSHAPALTATTIAPTVTPPLPAAAPPVRMVQHSPLLIPVPPPAPVDMPAKAAQPAPDNSGGSGTSAGAGQGSGSGTGKGDGRGHGNGSGGAPFGVGSGGTGTGEGPRHVVYVLDISGSMTSRIDRAREELRGALAGLRPDESFDIITFSDEVHDFSNLMNPVTPFMIQRADYFLGTLQVRGGTNLEGALGRALGMPGVNIVYVLTDGVPTQLSNGDGIDDSDKYMAQFPRRVREMNVSHARIYTVGLVGKDPDGRDVSFEAAGMLRQISRDSGGVSKIVPLGVAAP